VHYDEPRLHHIAFEVKDWAELQRGCELLQKNGIPLVWGPLRHIVGHNVAAYHRNQDGVRVELYCEMDMMKDEALGYWDPRPWHEEMPLRPKKWPKDTPRSAWVSDRTDLSPDTREPCCGFGHRTAGGEYPH